MSNSWFRFKRFTIEQAGAAMKVGTDGVLLGAWASVSPGGKTAVETNAGNEVKPEQAAAKPFRILDVGAGTGLIAIMAAQRTEGMDAAIDAVEIEEGSFRQARENAAGSPWAGRIEVFHASLQDFAADGRAGMYDRLISNPPYFENSLTSPEQGRTTARHTVSLGFADLAACAAVLLAPYGVLSVILPSQAEDDFTRTAAGKGLHLFRKLTVCPLPDAPPKRVLMEFSRGECECPVAETLVIESSPGNNFTEEYRALTRDFYLKF